MVARGSSVDQSHYTVSRTLRQALSGDLAPVWSERPLGATAQHFNRIRGTRASLQRCAARIGLIDLNMEERPMKVILLAAAMATSTAFGVYAAGAQLSQAECDTLWNKANPSGSSTITQAQAQPYVTNFRGADSDSDGTLDQSEFSAACKSGIVKDSASSGAASGETGSKAAPAEKMAPASKLPPKGY